MLGHAGTVLYCAEVLTPEVVSCAGAGAVAGAGAGAGAGASSWRRFAFCLLIARVHFIWLVYFGFIFVSHSQQLLPKFLV